MKFLLFTHNSLKHASLLLDNVFDIPDANHPNTTAGHMENWDDDFEAETQNNLPRKKKLSRPR